MTLRGSTLLVPLLFVAHAASAQEVPVTAELVRTLYFQQDYSGAAALGRLQFAERPADVELRAWTVLALTLDSQQPAAAALADSLVQRWPRSHWSHGAQAMAYAWAPGEQKKDPAALAAAQQALKLAPTDRYARWMYAWVLDNQKKYDDVIAFADSSFAKDRWSGWLVAKARAQMAKSYPTKPNEPADTVLSAAALATYAAARELDSNSLAAHLSAGSTLLSRRRVDEALPLLKRAAELSPNSGSVHSTYWRAIQGRRDLSAEQKRAEIVADAERMLAARPQSVALLSTVSNVYRELQDWERLAAIEQRILTEFAGTEQEEWVLMSRQRALVDSISKKQVADSAEARRRYADMLWSFVERPKHVREALKGDAYLMLLHWVGSDSTLPPEKLLQVVQGVAKYNLINPSTTHSRGPVLLANRGVYLDEAEQIVRAGFRQVEEYMKDRKDSYSVADWANTNDWLRATHQAALGWVLHKQGRTKEGRAQLDSALTTQKNNSSALYYLGQIEEAAGNLEEAERHYAKGRGFETFGEKPNTAALKKLYEKQHGSLDGYDAYAAALDEKDRDRRWQAVVDGKRKEPRALPAFSLERMEGGTLASADLAGKILVVNFWGVWCGPCVHETPELEKLHQKLKAADDVLFLTIDNDQNPETVRSFMAEKKLTFPVLLDDGFVSKAGISAFPTTWFVDRHGDIQYEHIGASDVVMEEFLWRVDLLRGATTRKPIT